MERELAEKFINFLDDEKVLYQKLLTILKKEKEVLIKADVKGLNENNNEKNALLHKIHKQKTLRNNIFSKFVRNLNIPTENLTLSQITTHLPPSGSIKIEKLNRQFLGLLEKIKKINFENTNFLKFCIENVDRSIEFINNKLSGNQDPSVYMSDCKKTTDNKTGSFLSWKI
ncbi:MAG: flagellar protein FlgN [Thermodesulfobacteriota bacterium]|nr:flagellar protein FlgN [Thermodesulfobacteriota bacterium]